MNSVLITDVIADVSKACVAKGTGSQAVDKMCERNHRLIFLKQ